MDFWMNMLDSEPMKIERVRDVIEKASNSKIKSRKKVKMYSVFEYDLCLIHIIGLFSQINS